MLSIPEFTSLQKRATYILLASSIAIGSLFITLSQGKASAPQTKIMTHPLRIVVDSAPSVKPVLVVDVSGKVLHPGVYSLPFGSRAIDAIKAAGNQLRGVSLTDINLAHLLSDGEQILVGAPVAISYTNSSSGKRSKSSQIIKSLKMLVNINTSTLVQLQVLKGIGPVTAAKVISYRKAHGVFVAVEDFKKASGMGATKFGVIKSQLRL